LRRELDDKESSGKERNLRRHAASIFFDQHLIREKGLPILKEAAIGIC